MAASYGQIALCEYFYEIRGAALFRDEFVRRAIQSNSLPLCDFIAGQPAGLAAVSNISSFVLVSADVMSAAMLDWLGNHGVGPHIQKLVYPLAYKATQTDNVDILAYLTRFGIENILGKTTDKDEVSLRKWKLSRRAAKYGACDALAWLNAHGLLTEYSEDLAPFAAQYGCVRVLDWLVANGLDEDEFCNRALAEAADAGRLDVLKWARRRFNVSRAVFAKYAGRHETCDAFIASLSAK